MVDLLMLLLCKLVADWIGSWRPWGRSMMPLILHSGACAVLGVRFFAQGPSGKSQLTVGVQWIGSYTIIGLVKSFRV